MGILSNYMQKFTYAPHTVTTFDGWIDGWMVELMAIAMVTIMAMCQHFSL